MPVTHRDVVDDELFIGNEALIIRPAARLKPGVFNRLRSAAADIPDRSRTR